MSFGFSVGDFVAVAELVESTRKRFIGAPAEYNALANETRTLQIVVTDIKIQVEDDELADSIKDDLRSANNNCESVLKDLNAVIDAHTELAPVAAGSRKKPQQIWKRFRWDPKKADQLRSRLVSSIQLLDAVRQSLYSTQQRDIAQDLKKLTVTNDNDELRRIADWLAPATYSEHQHDYFTRVQPGTGQWVLADPLFCNWLNSKGPSTLLLPGIPGAGKTFVASIIINELQAHVSRDDTTGLVFFYNSFRRTAAQSCRHILSSMVRQLYLQQPHKDDTVRSLYEEHTKRQPATVPSLEELSATLEKLLSGFSVVVFVIDALDECKGPEESNDRPWRYIPTFLFRLQEKLKSQVAIKVLATSRPDLEIDGIFPKDGRLTIHARNDDLGKFCDSLLPNIRCVAQKTHLHPKIKEAICESAGGMFLLAKLHCDTLAAKTKPKDVLQALETFGRGGDALDRAYQDTFQRIQRQPKEQNELAKKVLVCVTYSAEPLTLDAVRHALAVDQETKELDPEYDLDNPDDVVSSCAGLVTIDSESKIVRLVHYTTQSFLESLGNQLMSDPHDFLASCCLNHLHLDLFAEVSIGQDHRYKDFPFFGYSARYWNWHISAGSGSISLKERAFSFLDDNARITNALHFLNDNASITNTLHFLDLSWENPVHDSCALHFLARSGLNDWITDYIDRGRPTDGEENDKVSYLVSKESATEYNHPLTENATPWIMLLTSWRDSKKRTPLWYAIRWKHASTAKLLIDLNNEILNDVDDLGWTPLMLALQYESEAAALRILQEPGMISWYQYRDWIGHTYLHGAAQNGLEAVVDRLLELVSAFDTSEARSVGISYTTSQDRYRCTPLLNAAGGGHLGTVKKLLAYSGGRELNFSDEDGRTPLHSAAGDGHLEVVQYLMSQDGIQPGCRDFDGWSALHFAASGGRVPVLEYLLGTGFFSADSTDFRGETALLLAAWKNNIEAVSYLTSRGDVDVNWTDEDGINALMLAADGVYVDVIAHLAPLVSDVNTTNKHGTTALHQLCGGSPWRYEESGRNFQAGFDSLVRNGASLDIKTNECLTPYEVLCGRLRDPCLEKGDLEILQRAKSIMEQYISATTGD
ncbi:uncharacterized protein Z520_03026 [Fonsecaea multimorphosa CBS 102226]|uniref:Uncharacterized protein n=1 Tax=Fonsecaea multimorphosa CBS 102226 TaxID=1442371 RepID=A0A0D2KXD1_9EURO|nr:uncharacterized protein Z520_03026 [Fonsecaea multimorphosa CBS 102226]KIY01474.1 hypothetical protein Z520_03026 [Fonsecaea multimorphosa CBS 102226]OAL28238.1 hypothetical protein AYO22_02944 [Fonsecaea multimorphosa]